MKTFLPVALISFFLASFSNAQEPCKIAFPPLDENGEVVELEEVPTDDKWTSKHYKLRMSNGDKTALVWNRYNWFNAYGNETVAEDECCVRWEVGIDEGYKGNALVGIAPEQEIMTGHLGRYENAWFYGADTKDVFFHNGTFVRMDCRAPKDGHAGVKRDKIVVTYCRQLARLTVETYAEDLVQSSKTWEDLADLDWSLATSLKKDKGKPGPTVVTILDVKSFCAPVTSGPTLSPTLSPSSSPTMETEDFCPLSCCAQCD
jgi:hypothetical protein